MHVEVEEIKNALNYYEIFDQSYIDKCCKCVENLNSLDNFNKKAEQVYEILYGNQSEKIGALWQTQNKADVFGKHHNPFVTSVLILLGCNLHKRNMEINKFDSFHKKLYKLRVRETLTNDIYIRKLDSVRISQMLWASYFINAKLIEVGRLQYENCRTYVKIHVPSGSKLEMPLVLKSLENSKREIGKFFNIKNPEYLCESWLLSKQINKLVGKDCNISKFYNLFDVENGSDATKDVLDYVFQEQNCVDYKNLKEDTSLQRLLKEQLLCGNPIKIGLGKLKKDYKTLTSRSTKE